MMMNPNRVALGGTHDQRAAVTTLFQSTKANTILSLLAIYNITLPVLESQSRGRVPTIGGAWSEVHVTFSVSELTRANVCMKTSRPSRLAVNCLEIDFFS